MIVILRFSSDFWQMTPSPSLDNPYLPTPVASPGEIDDGPTTPRSLARNHFSLPRPTMISPMKTPSKPSRLRNTTVFLPASRRTISASPVASSPEDAPLQTMVAAKASDNSGTTGDEPPSVDKALPCTQPEPTSLNPFLTAVKPTVIPETVWSPTLLDAPLPGTAAPSFTPTQLSTQVIEARRDDAPAENRVILASSVPPSPVPSEVAAMMPSSATSSDQELSSTAWVYAERAPRSSQLPSLEDLGLPSMVYQPPFYSDRADVPARPKVFAGRQFHLKGKAVADLETFQHMVRLEEPASRRHLFDQPKPWEYSPLPPRRSVVAAFIAKEDARLQAEGTDNTGNG